MTISTYTTRDKIWSGDILHTLSITKYTLLTAIGNSKTFAHNVECFQPQQSTLDTAHRTPNIPNKKRRKYADIHTSIGVQLHLARGKERWRMIIVLWFGCFCRARLFGWMVYVALLLLIAWFSSVRLLCVFVIMCVCVGAVLTFQLYPSSRAIQRDDEG